MQLSLEETEIKITPSPSLISAIQQLDPKIPVTKRIQNFQKKKAQTLLTDVNFQSSVTTQDLGVLKNLKVKSESVELLDLDFGSKSNGSYLNIVDLKIIKNNLPHDVYLHEVLKDCKFHIPQNEIQERNPALEKRCEILRSRQANDAYKQMTRNVDSVRSRLPEDTIAYQLKEINKQLIAVAQFVISVLAGFAFGFIGVELIIGSLDFGFRLLLGVICALIIALAEIYFLAKKLNEFNDYIEGVKDQSVFPKGPSQDVVKDRKQKKPHQD